MRSLYHVPRGSKLVFTTRRGRNPSQGRDLPKHATFGHRIAPPGARSAALGSGDGAEDGDRDLVADRPEGDLDGHPDAERVEVAVDERGDDARPFVELDDGGHVRDALVEGGQVVLVHDRVRVERASATGRLP